MRGAGIRSEDRTSLLGLSNHIGLRLSAFGSRLSALLTMLAFFGAAGSGVLSLRPSSSKASSQKGWGLRTAADILREQDSSLDPLDRSKSADSDLKADAELDRAAASAIDLAESSLSRFACEGILPQVGVQYASLGGNIAPLLVGQAQGELEFERLKREAFKAWEEKRWEDSERLFVQASNYGPLGEVELRFVSFMRRCFLDRPEEALPIAEYNYRQNPCFLSAMELCECYADNYNFRRARDFLRELLEIPKSATPEETLSIVKNRIGTISAEGYRVTLRAILERVGIKYYDLTFILSPDVLDGETRNDIKSRGYYEFSVYPDCGSQRISFQVIGAKNVEEKLDRAGNRRLTIWPRDDRDPEVKMKVVLIADAYDLQVTEPQANAIPAEIQCFLGKTRLIDPTGECAVSLARQLKGATRIETFRNIRMWWDGVEYATPKTSDSGESEVMLSEKRGHCWEQSRGLVAVLRAMGIPARQIYALGLQGVLFGNLPERPTIGGHALAEFWDPEYGWIQWEPAKINPETPQRRLIETHEDVLKIIAEDPDENFPLGTVVRQYRNLFYGWKDNSLDPPDCRNTDITLRGLSLVEAD